MVHGTLPVTTANHVNGEVHLLIGSGANRESSSVTTRRIKSLGSAGAKVIVVQPSFASHEKSLNQALASCHGVLLNRSVRLSDLTTLGRALVGKVVDRVFVNLPHSELLSVRQLHEHCMKMRIPINTFHMPEFSTFHLVPTFVDPNGSGLQIHVAANGNGYVLANRILRELVAALPSNISQIVNNMALLKNMIINEDISNFLHNELAGKTLEGLGLDDDEWESHKFNHFIKESDNSSIQRQTRRTRWLSQVMEYYPLNQLADLTLEDLDSFPRHESKSINIADSHVCAPIEPDIKGQSNPSEVETNTKSLQDGSTNGGSISLVGSGPGSVSMLTIGALNEIRTADLILADKLVPQDVLNLIPKSTETFIARKFPGNAERAQQELLAKGLEGLQNGRKVVRLKQGDPYIFGRGGEEFLFFTEHGYEPIVLPGLSSSLASTVVARIPATQRSVADQVLICTGTGRKGALPDIPEYVSTRTTIFLMVLHRIEMLKSALLERKWDPEVPVAIVERASCPDQRITRTKLKYIVETVEEIGSRPPGLLVIGNATGVLVPSQKMEFNDSYKYFTEEGYRSSDIDLDELGL